MLVTQLRPRGQRGSEEQAGGRPPRRHQALGGRHQDGRRHRACGRAVPLHVQQGVGRAGHGGDAQHSGLGRRVLPVDSLGPQHVPSKGGGLHSQPSRRWRVLLVVWRQGRLLPFDRAFQLAIPKVDETLGFDYASGRTDIGWELGETRLRGPAQRGDRQYLIWVMPAQGHAKSKSREPLARGRRLHVFGAHAGIPKGRVQWTPHW